MATRKSTPRATTAKSAKRTAQPQKGAAKSTKPRQRPIAVRTEDREVIQRYKRKYDRRVRKDTDWATFLKGGLLLGLAALGVDYFLGQVRQNNGATAVRCGHCDHVFPAALPVGQPGNTVQIQCPQCRNMLIVPT